MSLRPLQDRILIRRSKEDETIVGGIVIPDTAREKSQRGEVIAVGKGQRLENGTVVPLEVQVGDTVLFGKYGGTEVTVDGEELLILRESEVLAIVDETPAARKAA
jgi:chaperonin GroES